MKIRLAFVFLVLMLLLIVCGAIWIPQYAVRVHQRSVIHSLVEWQDNYGRIESLADAIRTAEMLEYIHTYYVPGPGYRASPQMEMALEAQRKRTQDAFITALKSYTGEDFGVDHVKWLRYLRSIDNSSATTQQGNKKEGEQNGTGLILER